MPPTDWLELTRHFIDLLHDEIIAEAGLENFHVLDSRAMAPPAPADPMAADPNWLNEIHLTAKGYDPIAPAFVNMVEAVLR
ncbi:hypothetical protein [Cupriavidus necator]